MRTDARDQPRIPETNEIAAQARSSEAERPGEAAEKPLPLSGIRVVDVGTFLAGPYAASIMGEFGAEVLKVEYPIGGDPMRRFGAPTKRSDATLAWLSEARNKKSVTIDLRGLEVPSFSSNWFRSLTSWWRISAPARWRNGASVGRC